MKPTLVFLTILVPLLSAVNIPEDFSLEDEEISDNVRTVNELHSGPPVQHRRIFNVATHWIRQKLDNFDANNTKGWYNQIFINEDLFEPGGPIFLYLGGQWAIERSTITEGLWLDIAEDFNAVIVYTEHRFFGKSIPIKPLSTENLKYQSTKQALADVVNVIKVLKRQKKYKNSKVVVSGCSYSATMAIWLKKLYPDLIVGSWASSPLLKAKVDFTDYMKIIGEAYNQLGGESCYKLINNATSYYQGLFENGQGDKAKEELNLCDDFDVNSEQDQWQLFSTIATVFARIAQYQQPRFHDLPKYCFVLRNYTTDDAEALSQFLQWRLGKPKCVNARYKRIVDYYRWSDNNYGGSGLGWFYLTCSQFGWFQSSGSKHQPFGSLFPATLYTETCKDVLGDDFTKEKIENYVRATNEEFGDINLNTDDIYITYGGLDPWKAVGEEQGALIIPLHSHCCDRGSISKRDPAELTAAKYRAVEVIHGWLD